MSTKVLFKGVLANSIYNFQCIKELRRPERKAAATTTKLRTQHLSLPWFPSFSIKKEGCMCPYVSEFNCPQNLSYANL